MKNGANEFMFFHNIIKKTGLWITGFYHYEGNEFITFNLIFIALWKNSPIRGWGGLSKLSNKMSKMSIIELSQLGQDLFDFSDLTWAHPLNHPSTLGRGVSTNHKSSKQN